MQCLAAKALQGGKRLRPASCRKPQLAVERVSDDGKAEVLHVDADLMGAPSLDFNVQQSVGAVAASDAVARPSRLAPDWAHGHFQAIARVAADVAADGAAGNRLALDQGPIVAAESALRELLDQFQPRLFIAGNDEKSAGVFVESVDDAGSGEGGEFFIEREEGVFDRAAPIAWRPVHDEAGRLVDDQQQLVFVDHIERNPFGLGSREFDGRRGLDPVAVASAHRRFFGGGGAVEPSLALFDPPLQALARARGAGGRQGLVESLPVLGGVERSLEPALILVAVDFTIHVLYNRVSLPPKRAFSRGQDRSGPFDRKYSTPLFNSMLKLMFNEKAPEAIEKGLRLLSFAALALLLASCYPPPELGTEGWTAEQLYRAGLEQVEQGNPDTAQEYFGYLEARHPFGEYSRRAQLQIAYSLYKRRKFEESIKVLERFAKIYPRDPQIDYVLYLRGLNYYDFGKGFFSNLFPRSLADSDQEPLHKSFEAFRQLLAQFPQSVYVSDARKRMLYLVDQMALHELNTARFYRDRAAYVGALGRLNYLLRHYIRSRHVSAALQLMAEVYREMGQPDLAAQAEERLRVN